MSEITNKTGVQLGLIITIVVIFLSGVFWLGRLSMQVDNNTNRIDNMSGDISEIKNDIKLLLKR